MSLGNAAVQLQLRLADYWLHAGSPAKPILRRALDLLRRRINEGRSILLALRPPVLPEGSLEKAILDMQRDLTPSQPTQFRMVIIGETKSMESGVQEQIFWILREALLNASRHSEANSVEIEIEYLRRKLRVAVRDNGIGINPQSLQSGTKSHWGLTGMRERGSSIGAEVRVWSKQGKGTEVAISRPW